MYPLWKNLIILVLFESVCYALPTTWFPDDLPFRLPVPASSTEYASFWNVQCSAWQVPRVWRVKVAVLQDRDALMSGNSGE